MATITSAQSGDFTDTATWVGGVVPGVGDVAEVVSDHVVNIDDDITCDELRRGTGSGNTFILNGEYTVNANILGSGSVGDTLTFTLDSGVATINGTVTGGNENFRIAVFGNGDGTLVINGNVSAGNGNYAHGIQGYSGNYIGELIINGDVTGGNQLELYAVRSKNAVITGDIYGGTAAFALGVQMSTDESTLTVYGNIYGGLFDAHGVFSSGLYSSIVVNGNCYAGETSSSNAVHYNGSSSNIEINGEVYASKTGYGVYSLNQVVLGGNFYDAANGRVSVFSPLRRVKNLTDSKTFYVTPEPDNADGSTVVHASLEAINNNVPLPEDVREGVEYSDSNFVGTLQLPPPEAVAAGVPVGDSVGTATLNIEEVESLFENFKEETTVANANIIGALFEGFES